MTILTLILAILAGSVAAPAPGYPGTQAAPAPGMTVPAVSSDATVRGNATWYRYVPGGAAAGPALRKALGSDWRGSRVTVCADGCTVVTLSDWCACGSRHGVPTVIDLDLESFRAIGDPGRGVIRVSVSFDAGPTPTLPPTDTDDQ